MVVSSGFQSMPVMLLSFDASDSCSSPASPKKAGFCALSGPSLGKNPPSKFAWRWERDDLLTRRRIAAAVAPSLAQSVEVGAVCRENENLVLASFPEKGMGSHTAGNSAAATLTTREPLSSLREESAVSTSGQEMESGTVDDVKWRGGRRIPWHKGEKILQAELESLLCRNAAQDLDERIPLLAVEIWRRQRISQGCKGRVPGNKGKRHSEETKQRIRTRLIEVMKDPKILAKVRAAAAHKKRPETRLKLSMIMSKKWKIKQTRERFVQEWKEMIAVVARRGDAGEVIYEWNSYTIIKKELQDAWRISFKKKMRDDKERAKEEAGPRTISLQHRARISEAIKAKWTDRNYQLNVKQGTCASRMSRGVQPREKRERPIYHRTKSSTSRRKKSKPHVGELDEITNSKKVVARSGNKSGTQGLKLDEAIPAYRDPIFEEKLEKLDKALPAYKDPICEEKLRKLRQIRASRLSKRELEKEMTDLAMYKRMQKEMTDRARFLLEEAKKTAHALEFAAVKYKSAEAPLLETRKLLEEAALSLETAGLGNYSSLNVPQGKRSDERHRIGALRDRNVHYSLKSNHKVSSTKATCYYFCTASANTSSENNILRIHHHMHFSVSNIVAVLKTKSRRRHLSGSIFLNWQFAFTGLALCTTGSRLREW